jgi:hypothetical protein
MVDYEVWLDDARGNRLQLLDDLLSFEWTRTANQIGWFILDLPADFDESLLQVDNLVEIWRAPEGGTLRLEFIGFIRNPDAEERGNTDVIRAAGPDQNDLIKRKIVAYKSTTAQTDKTSDPADDMLKAVVRENLGSLATDTDRDLTALGFTVAADLSAGPNVSKSMAYDKVLETLQEICKQSSQAGTELYFDIVPGFDSTGLVTFEFRTFTGQLGADRTLDSGAPLFFGREWGNLQNCKLEHLYSDEVNVVYAGGQGEGTARVLEERPDESRISLSVWNRREAFVDARSEKTTALVQAKGDEALNAGRPILRFGGDLVDSEDALYGRDWFHGDRVTCEYRGQQFDGMIKAIKVSVNADGNETIQARVEVEA